MRIIRRSLALDEFGHMFDIAVGIGHTHHSSRLQAAVHIVHGYKLILRDAVALRQRIDRLPGHHHMIYISVVRSLVQVLGIFGHVILCLLLRRRSDLGLAHPQRLTYGQCLRIHVRIVFHERRHRDIVVTSYAIKRLPCLDLMVQILALAFLLGARLCLHLLRHGDLYRLVDLQPVRRRRIALLDRRLAHFISLGYRIERIACLDCMDVILLTVDEDYHGSLVHRRHGINSRPAGYGRRKYRKSYQSFEIHISNFSCRGTVSP